jgi:hypothetical protein
MSHGQQDNTLAEPQVKLSMLRSNSLKPKYRRQSVHALATIFGLENQVQTKPNGYFFNPLLSHAPDCLPLSIPIYPVLPGKYLWRILRVNDNNLEAPDCIPTPPPIMVINYPV